MREYRVSGVNVLDKWFSYRRKNRTRPTIGERAIWFKDSEGNLLGVGQYVYG